MLNMLENPQVQQTMNEALQNPAIIDMMIQQNPMLRDMGPGVRQMMESPEFRRMLTDPAAIRQMAQLQRSMGGMGGGLGGLGGLGLGGGAGNAGFPAPGVTNTTPEENRGQRQTDSNQTANTTSPPPLNPFQMPGMAGNPFAGLFGLNPAGGAGSPPAATGSEQNDNTNPTGQNTTVGATQNPQNQNPFAALFNNPSLFGFPPTQAGADGNAGSQQPGGGFANPNFNPQTNAFLRDPALLSNFMQAMGGGQPGGNGATGSENPWAGLFGSAPSAPPDNRPPEERYAEQLRQLNDMGFHQFERNIEALRRTGGSVQGAVEYLLSNPS
jgi:ubiquilin